MENHVILMFAYHYPPENAIGADRPFRFAKYLTRLGYACRVFTAAPQAGRVDPAVEHVPDPFFTRPRASFAWQFERAVRKFVVPGDLGTQWSYHAARAARAWMRRHRGVHCTLFSTYPPLGAHLAALLLAGSERLPWIADFRDPLAMEGTGGPDHPVQRRVYSRLERRIAERSAAIVANTDAAMSEWREKFPAFGSKVHVIWNGFDPEEHVAPLPLLPGAGPYVLSHAGELYGGRNAAPILESIARLVAAGRAPRAGLRVRLVGTAKPDALPGADFLKRAQSEGWLELVNERIPKPEALRMAESSHGLLLLQPHSATQVPGKLFEYVRLGRPVLAFVQPDSPSERLLARSAVRYQCVYPGAAPEVMDHLLASFFALPPVPAAPSVWFAQKFNAENQARQLHTIIRSLPSYANMPAEQLLVGSVAIASKAPAGKRGYRRQSPHDLRI